MALNEYKRFSDSERLAQDSNLEVTEVLYPPHFESIEDANVGSSDATKVGAVATAMVEGVVTPIVYQGGGIWKSAGNDARAREIAEYITSPKLEVTDFINCEWVEGKCVLGNGAEYPLPTFSYTKNFIPVVEGVGYTFTSSAIAIVWFDEDEVVIGASGSVSDPIAQRTFVAPAGSAFCKINQPNLIKGDFVLWGDTDGLGVKKNIIDASDIKGVNQDLVTKVAKHDDQDWLIGAIATNGSVYDYLDYSFTANFIKVEPATDYTMQTSGIAIAWYDKDQNFISLSGVLSDTLAIRTFESPANASYMRVNQLTDEKHKWVVYSGSTHKISVTIPDLDIEAKQVKGGLIEANSASVIGGIGLFDFDDFTISGNVLISGDSTISAYSGQPAIASFLNVSGTLTDISAPANSIASQEAAYDALSSGIRTSLNLVFIQIGLNDLNPAGDMVAKIAVLSGYISKIKTDSPSCKIVLGTMIPCRQVWFDIYGANGAIAQANWEILNNQLKFIIGVDIVTDLHTIYMRDDVGNLKAQYDTGDHIHENAEGRKIIAWSWINSIGSLELLSRNSIKIYDAGKFIDLLEGATTGQITDIKTLLGI